MSESERRRRLIWRSYRGCSLLGYYDGVRLLEAEGLDLAGYAAMTEASGPAATQMLVHHAHTVISGQYGEPEATLATCHRRARRHSTAAARQAVGCCRLGVC